MEENEFNYINVIPLVDVMLVLLTIVLTTSTFIATGAISISLPQASPSRVEAVQRQIITIDPLGSIYFNTRRVTPGELGMALTDINRDTCLIVRADRSVRLQVFVDVLDLLNNRGFKKVTIQTEQRR